mgnify:FL=1
MIWLLFHVFEAREERRNYGGSAFIEIQFCDMPRKTSVKKTLNFRHIQHWKTDSLYIYADDIDTFFREYGSIFDCGIYNNMKTGTVDLFGINYYTPIMTEAVIEKLDKEKPEDYEVLAAWLFRAKAHNGFYILGI